jgi:hypothetical protein
MIRCVKILVSEKYGMEDKITIIEGPPPTFEAVNEGWALSLIESPLLFRIGLTRLRTFNGPALLERCHRAWRHRNMIQLEFRDESGLENSAPILAARTLEVDEGQMLLLWVRLEIELDEISVDSNDDLGEEDLDDDQDDDLDFPNL